MPDINKNFDPTTVALKGSNLIEASAGTGKTYSIALMALRLILENNIPIQKILLVTFTKAAVAELELRVRSFVRLALKASRSEQIADKTIANLVQKNIDQLSSTEVERRLATAQLFLDEVSVLTIHSFCQQTLSAYAFETGQIFGAETISPDEFNQLADDSFLECWRQKITTLDPVLLEQLLAAGLSRDEVRKQVKEALDGKLLSTPIPIPGDFLSVTHQRRVLNQLSNDEKEIHVLTEAIIDSLEKCNDLLPNVNKNHHAKKAFLEIIEQGDWGAVINKIKGNPSLKYVQTIFVDQLPQIERLSELEEAKQTALKIFINHVAQQAFKWVESDLAAVKKLRGFITFDDMISLLHSAVLSGESRNSLIAHLREKYQAVFIDEFQDTDRQQYEIFETLFGSEHILFYIGDPKQSIYGWRKADITTYFKAAQAVQFIHHMNVNHRSSQSFINAMNGFFLPEENFDTFHYGNDPNGIQYHPVSSPEPNTKGNLLYQQAPITPIKISEFGKKEELTEGVVSIVMDLLFSGNYQIEKDNSKRSIKASDIGILVRSNKEGKAVKDKLAAYRIPAITIDDGKLLQSDEANDLYYVMLAVQDITRSNINRALVSALGGYSLERLRKADEEAILQRFSTYQETWKSEGVYVMLRQFLSDHELNDILNRDDIVNPERIVSNILQLVEIIHKVSVRKNYDPVEQLQWLKKSISGAASEGDEYEQRIENDEDAIKIVTIHKSKGLEYNIVIAPFLDMNSESNNYSNLSYRHPVDGRYYSANKDLIADEEKSWCTQQQEQENRRLLYVAITRARYACFITANTGGKYNNSCLRTFLNVINNTNIPGVEYFTPPASHGFSRQQNQEQQFVREYAKAGRFELRELNWRRSSYSALNPEHGFRLPVMHTGSGFNEYDQFIFRDLKKGAFTGNLLHYIFENISFNYPEYWDRVIKKAVKRIASQQDDQFDNKISEMLTHISNVKLIPGNDFTLSMLDKEKRLNELEFDFPFQLFNTDAMQALSSPGAPFVLRGSEQMEGIMNGKIDLFFEFDGKYYILDWKSNHLGDTPGDYGAEQLQQAMTDNNYHLQYHVYTVAVCKYLSLRVPGFEYARDFGGVIYVFVRGVRQDKDTGIYFTKPDEKVIRELNVICSGKEEWV